VNDKYDPIAYLSQLRSANDASPGYKELGQLMRWVVWAQDRIHSLRDEQGYLSERNAELGAEVARLREQVDKNPPVRKALPRRDVFELDGWKCAYCKCEVSMETGHADHLVPLSQGGSDELCNLVASCASCNLSKGSREPHEWNPVYSWQWLGLHMEARASRQQPVQPSPEVN
jgi:5-methylcytosine-specific restriction endonuclease McrA